MIKNKRYLMLVFLVGIVLIAGCAKEETGTTPTTAPKTPKGTLVLQLTDAKPELDITKAIVDVSDVEVHLAAAGEDENATTEAGWFMVAEGAQRFDLVDIKDAKVLLGTAELDPGRYTQVRLNVESASIEINGSVYDLTIPSKKIKLVKGFRIEKDKTTTLTLDFDLQESVHAAGEDKYMMKPTIKIIEE